MIILSNCGAERGGDILFDPHLNENCPSQWEKTWNMQWLIPLAEIFLLDTGKQAEKTPFRYKNMLHWHKETTGEVTPKDIGKIDWYNKPIYTPNRLYILDILSLQRGKTSSLFFTLWLIALLVPYLYPKKI